MAQEKVFYENDGQRIAAVMHLPKAKTDKCVILVHGFTGDKDTEGDSDIYPRLSNALAKTGFAVLRFDCRGSGESEGKFEDMTLTSEKKDLEKSIQYAKERGFKKIGVVGASLGGCIALLAYDGNMDCIVLWYPAIFPNDTLGFLWLEEHEKELQRNGKILYKEKNGRKFYVGHKLYLERKTEKPYDNIKTIMCPVLFITGDKDTRVNYSQSQKAFAAAKEPKKLEIIKGADHCFTNPDGTLNQDYMNRAIELTVQWFVKQMK